MRRDSSPGRKSAQRSKSPKRGKSPKRERVADEVELGPRINAAVMGQQVFSAVDPEKVYRVASAEAAAVMQAEVEQRMRGLNQMLDDEGGGEEPEEPEEPEEEEPTAEPQPPATALPAAEPPAAEPPAAEPPATDPELAALDVAESVVIEPTVVDEMLVKQIQKVRVGQAGREVHVGRMLTSARL